MSCFTSSRFNMKATILRQSGTHVDETEEGRWETVQDPDSGAVTRVWVEDSESSEPGIQSIVISCEARGITGGGIRAAGTTQRFTDIYENIDWVTLTFPAGVVLTKRDRITNISNGAGSVIWREEEIEDSPASVFNVMGSTPIIDPFGNHIENTALLQRSEVQTSGS